ncbi:WD40-repeat-containing domain protein [Jimgerdemannia flammicorona]|uniref:Pre-mRNA-processing factor 19 n=1 Tax=Jimgerdemannia flammicorona TaxID=994334 RepID=A0A433D1C6_9FUNG|nr:WD40-repeat-containing domain protein [Jimgerdemannia flammicorona]
MTSSVIERSEHVQLQVGYSLRFAHYTTAVSNQFSGEPPEFPVVSVKSGQVYEKRLIIKYINDNGKEPTTDEPLSLDDLVDLKTSPKTVKPRPPTLTSIPSLLSVFQNEWDSLMLETFTLKQQYQQVRQELSHALYQHDAACRVIARLVKERDSAREALVNVQAHLGVAPSADAAVPEQDATMEVDAEAGGLPADVVEKMTQTSTELSKGRKKRKPPTEGYTSSDSIKEFSQVSSIPSLHASRPPGISSLDLDHTRGLVLTGGNDKHVLIYNRDEDKTVATLKGHTKKVNAVAWRGRTDGDHDVALSAGADKTVRIWAPSEKGHSLAHSIQCHTGEVTGVTVHPSLDYFASASHDSTWAFHDIETGKTYVQKSDPESQSGYTSVQFHPDGMILGTGMESVVRIWDVKGQQNIATFPSHTGKVRAMAFSENG